jgi:hypothetical protein
MLRGASLKLLRNVIFQFLDECFLFGKSSGCNVCILNIEHFYGELSFPAKLSLLLTQAITHKLSGVAVCSL